MIIHQKKRKKFLGIKSSYMIKPKRIPSKVLNKNGVKVPTYIKLGKTTMRYRKIVDDYYRDGGCWSTKYDISTDGRLFSNIPHAEHINNIELIQITKKEWALGNGQYTPNNSIIKKDLKIK